MLERYQCDIPKEQRRRWPLVVIATAIIGKCLAMVGVIAMLIYHATQ